MVEEGYQVRIEWIDFEMENAWSGTKCKFDYAALVDAAGQVNFLWQTIFCLQMMIDVSQPLAGNTGWTSCGNALPPNVVSESNR